MKSIRKLILLVLVSIMFVGCGKDKVITEVDEYSEQSDYFAYVYVLQNADGEGYIESDPLVD